MFEFSTIIFIFRCKGASGSAGIGFLPPVGGLCGYFDTSRLSSSIQVIWRMWLSCTSFLAFQHRWWISLHADLVRRERVQKNVLRDTQGQIFFKMFSVIVRFSTDSITACCAGNCWTRLSKITKSIHSTIVLYLFYIILEMTTRNDTHSHPDIHLF